MSLGYSTNEPSRDEVDAIPGPAVIEFGANWCSICRGAYPVIAEAFSAHPGLLRIKVEDGKGRPLGRSFRVKLWPTLIFLKDGKEAARVVRPTGADEIRAALVQIQNP
jgi:thioredoxin 1